VNAQLRAYYAEGSKTVRFDIAERLGWRLPLMIVAPIGSGALYWKIFEGMNELRELRLVDGPATRMSGGQAEGCSPVADALPGKSGHTGPPRDGCPPAIGNPADGDLAVATAQNSGCAVYALAQDDIAPNIGKLARLTEIWGETATAVTYGALKEAVRRAEPGSNDTVVLPVSGAGLETPGLVSGLVEPTTIAADSDAFLDLLETRSGARRLQPAFHGG